LDTATAYLFARYRAWADTLTYDAVASLPPGAAAKERTTLFKSMIGTLNHNYLIDCVWQAHLEGRDHGFSARNLILYADLAGLWEAQQAMNRWWIDWSEVQSDRSLAETVNFRFIGGAASAMTRGAMLLHVVNHATYHRGWIAEMFFGVPASNPTTDLPAFLRQMAQRG
jgi:uncharacterized damage-inducible protein DinB